MANPVLGSAREGARTLETIGEDRRRRRVRQGVAAGIGLALCATVAAVLVVGVDSEPPLQVETAKPPVPDVAPAARGIEAPATKSTTAEVSPTSTSVSPSGPPSSTTTTSSGRRPPITSPTVTTATAPATPTFAERYVGLRYRHVGANEQFPPGVDHIGGTLIGSANRYAIEWVREGRHEAFWFIRFLTPPGRDRLVQVLDAVDLPERETGEFFEFDCAVDQRSDPEIAAIVHSGKERILSNIRQAWRFNRETESIAAVSIENVTCRNSGYATVP